MEILEIVFVIIGAIIGAGFASGKEIYLFFFSYGAKGLIGVLISSVIMGFAIYKTLIISKINDIENYNQFLETIIKNRVLKNLLNTIINIFILITFYIMIAAFGTYLEQNFGINKLLANGLFAIICFVVLCLDVKGFVKINKILVPMLISVILIIGSINVKNIRLIDIYNLSQINYNWILSSIEYASYNMIIVIPILISISGLISKYKNIKKVSIITSIIVFILTIIIFTIMLNITENISNIEMPAVYAISKMSTLFNYLYGIIILLSIFTTAISLGISFLKDVTKDKHQYMKYNIFMLASGIIFSNIGFSNLVGIFYPILGAIGIIQILKICCKKT